MAGVARKPRVFVSHSSKDKPFVRVLVGELQDRGVSVWFDEQELGVGDSIVSGVNSGLTDSDYLLIILSKASVESKWVKAELNTALMRQLSDGGVVVLPALLEDCDIPPLLRDRIYADFRASKDKGKSREKFQEAVRKLLEVFDLEEDIVRYSAKLGPLGLEPSAREDCQRRAREQCVKVLDQYSPMDLRRMVHAKLAVDEIRAVWFDTFDSDMYDDSRDKTKLDRSVDLLMLAKREDKLQALKRNLCHSYYQKLPCTTDPA